MVRQHLFAALSALTMIVWAGLLAEGEVGRGRGKDSWAGLSSQQVCVCVWGGAVGGHVREDSVRSENCFAILTLLPALVMKSTPGPSFLI